MRSGQPGLQGSVDGSWNTSVGGSDDGGRVANAVRGSKDGLGDEPRR